MKTFFLFNLLLLLSPALLADDAVDSVKAEFKKLMTHTANQSDESFSYFADDCTLKLIRKVGEETSEVIFKVQNQRHEFAKRLTSQEKGENTIGENLTFLESGDQVLVSGTFKRTDKEDQTDFVFFYEKNKSGRHVIQKYQVTQHSQFSKLSFPGFVEFEFPGQWVTQKPVTNPLSEDQTMRIGPAESPDRKTSVVCFGYENTDPQIIKVFPLEKIPFIVGDPLIQSAKAKGTEVSETEISKLDEENPDVLLFSMVLTPKEGTKNHISGIAVRGKSRIYAIQESSAFPPNRALWKKTAASLKEL